MRACGSRSAHRSTAVPFGYALTIKWLLLEIFVSLYLSSDPCAKGARQMTQAQSQSLGILPSLVTKSLSCKTSTSFKGSVSALNIYYRPIRLAREQW